MELTEAVRVARKNLADTFNLKLLADDTRPGKMRMYGSGDLGNEAADAYNRLAEFHAKGK